MRSASFSCKEDQMSKKKSVHKIIHNSNMQRFVRFLNLSNAQERQSFKYLSYKHAYLFIFKATNASIAVIFKI